MIATSDGWTPLMAAAGTQTIGCRARVAGDRRGSERRDNHGWTALLAAADVGSEEIAQDLIDDKADIEFTSDEGWTPLLVAADRGHRRLVELLLEHGARVDAPTTTAVYAQANGDATLPRATAPAESLTGDRLRL